MFALGGGGEVGGVFSVVFFSFFPTDSYFFFHYLGID